MKLFIISLAMLLSNSISFAQDPQPAFITDIQKKNGQTVLVLDYVDIKFTGGMNDFKIINNNKKLRSFPVSKNCRIENCSNIRNITLSNLYQKRSELITSGSKKILVFVTLNHGAVSGLNIDCIN